MTLVSLADVGEVVFRGERRMDFRPENFGSFEMKLEPRVEEGRGGMDSNGLDSMGSDERVPVGKGGRGRSGEPPRCGTLDKA